jgi:hypothetical protein
MISQPLISKRATHSAHISKMPAASISHRDYIRRNSGPCTEPTSTLVLTSKSGWYIDVRILLPEPRPDAGQREKLKKVFKDGDIDDAEFFEEAKGGSLTVERLDWAFSGQSHATPAKGKEPGFSKWEHWLDSKTGWDEPPEEDEGLMYPQDDGRTLEKGGSVNPDTGEENTYEEMWRDVKIGKSSTWPSNNWCCVTLVLEQPEKKSRGSIMRLGSYCQGVKKVGEEFCAERWKYEYPDECKGGKWCLLARVGKGKVGCEVLFSKDNEDEKELGEMIKVGKRLDIAGDEWKVTEVESTW